MEDPAKPPFDSIYSQGFVRRCRPRNFFRTGISAYSNEDLFLQDALLDAVEAGPDRLLDASHELPHTEGELLTAAWEGIES